jgi:hypothetical protein
VGRQFLKLIEYNCDVFVMLTEFSYNGGELAVHLIPASPAASQKRA